MQHHANLLIGPKEWAFSIIPKEHTKESQDVRILDYDTMNIRDARDLIRGACLKPVENDVRVFVVVAHTILREAQNTLLKLIEEPNQQTLFYFVVSREDTLIPTLRSRFHLLDTNTTSELGESFGEFLEATYADRIKLIEKKLKEEDKDWMRDIVEGMEVHAYKTKDKKIIKDVLMLVRYININGNSKKMLLEHVALSL